MASLRAGVAERERWRTGTPGRRAELRTLDGAERIAPRHARGKLTARERIGGAFSCLAFVVGCTSAPVVRARFDPTPLASLAAGTTPAALARLSESTPHLSVDAEGVAFFLCRWKTDAAIPVSLPADADDEERALLRRAFAAWQASIPGLAFVETLPGARASIELVFAAAGRFDAPGLSGATRADCRLRPGTGTKRVFDAELVWARIALARRTPRDWRDRDRALAAGERFGTALHEIGHALGFAGHVTGGDSVMTRTREDVVGIATRVLAGGALREAAIASLYALPSGVVVRRAALSAPRAEPFERLASAARERGMAGPFSRVGDEIARVFWVGAEATEAGVDVPGIGGLASDPTRLVGLLDPRARGLVEALSASALRP